MGKKKKKRGKKKQKKAKRKISWNYIFSYGNNLALNSLIAVFLVGLAFLIIFYQRQLSLKEKPSENVALMGNNEAEIERIRMDMSSWKKYQNLWYGFELKYPESWEKPKERGAPADADWEYRYEFRKKDPGKMENSCAESLKQLDIPGWQLKYLFYKKGAEENNPFSGFNMIIYDVEKIKELTNTDEFPAVKNEELKAAGACDQIEGHLWENENYPAEKIHILSDDNCYNSVFFYSLTREKYIYNVVPVLKENLEISADLEKEAIDNFPEFFSIASSFNLVDIKRPKPVLPKPRITPPKPAAAAKNSAGRMVCAKKNDHPGKSNKNKSKHLDMECCLDPDEYPNPHCYYPPEKYGKYLK